MTKTEAELPASARDDATVAGHWLLARLGKRVLRPGGAELTTRLLAAAHLAGADVVELAPGLGRTATDIMAIGPASYRGVDNDPAAVRLVEPIVAPRGRVHTADAAETGLAGDSADVIVGEAMLTMQGDKSKAAIIDEAVRVLRPGGRYAIHELGLAPDDLADEVKTDIRHALARSIKVNARPLTLPEWAALLESHGLIIDSVQTAPMALLELRRLIADEGLLGVLRFTWRVSTRPVARRRVLAMRSTFQTYRRHLTAVAIVARKPAADDA